MVAGTKSSYYYYYLTANDFPTNGKTVYWTFEVINLSDEIYINGKDPEEALEREAGYTQKGWVMKLLFAAKKEERK